MSLDISKIIEELKLQIKEVVSSNKQLKREIEYLKEELSFNKNKGILQDKEISIIDKRLSYLEKTSALDIDLKEAIKTVKSFSESPERKKDSKTYHNGNTMKESTIHLQRLSYDVDDLHELEIGNSRMENLESLPAESRRTEFIGINEYGNPIGRKTQAGLRIFKKEIHFASNSNNSNLQAGVSSLSSIGSDLYAIGLKNGTILFMNSTSHKVLKVKKEHNSDINSLMCFGSDNYLASAGDDGQILIWDSKAFEVKYKIKIDGKKIKCIEVVSDAYLYAGDNKGNIYLVDYIEKKIIREIDAHKEEVVGICLAFKDNLLVSISLNGELKFWNCSEFTEEESKRYIFETCLSTVAYINKQVLAIGDCNGNIHIYNFSSNKVVNNLVGHYKQIYRILVFGSNLVSCSFDSTVRIWDWTSAECLKKLDKHFYEEMR